MIHPYHEGTGIRGVGRPGAEARFRALEDEAVGRGRGPVPAHRPRPEIPPPSAPAAPTAGTATAIRCCCCTGPRARRCRGRPTGCPGGRAAYALDTIGDVGRSRQTVPVRRPGDLVTWLDETLAGLALDTVHVAGTSYGGFLGLLLAVHRPERVASLTLLDPGGIVRLRLARFLAWGTACLLASRLPDRPRRAAGRALRMPALDDRRLLGMILYGQRHHRVRLLAPEPLTDDDLRSVAAPVLLMVGARSEVHDVRAMVDRATALLPDVDAEVVPGAGPRCPSATPTTAPPGWWRSWLRSRTAPPRRARPCRRRTPSPARHGTRATAAGRRWGALYSAVSARPPRWPPSRRRRRCPGPGPARRRRSPDRRGPRTPGRRGGWPR